MAGEVLTSESTEEADATNLPAAAERNGEMAARITADRPAVVFPPQFTEPTAISVFTMSLQGFVLGAYMLQMLWLFSANL